jgi:hypothetical protein
VNKKLPRTHNKILDLTEADSVNENFKKKTKCVEWNTFKELLNANVAYNENAKVIDIKYTIYGGQTVARLQMCKTLESNIAYIRWVRVHEKFQNQGLGKIIYSEFCQNFTQDCQCILLKPVSIGMKKIAEYHNFTTCDQLPTPWKKKELL